jgi:predicted nucleic acid-binding protein
MSEPTSMVICNAGPLIHLDELSCLSLLNDFTSVLVPDQVWQEMTRYRPRGLTKPHQRFQSVEVTISSEPMFQTWVQSLSLDIGEQAALSLLCEHPQSIFLTDDAAARLAATTYLGSYRTICLTMLYITVCMPDRPVNISVPQTPG